MKWEATLWIHERPKKVMGCGTIYQFFTFLEVKMKEKRLYSASRRGSALNSEQCTKFYSEVSREGVAILSPEEVARLITSLKTRKNDVVPTKYFQLDLNFSTTKVTLAWPGDAGGEKVTFLTDLLISYLG